jgi:type II secretory pathway component PulF
MKSDEFAFFNQQLAAMLRNGIPLEGALQRLCQEMRRGQLRDELQALGNDLAQGTPLNQAIAPRALPELYKRMVVVGTQSGDLPEALTMLADYFQKQSNLWTRLKGLLVYPVIVLFSALLISCLLAYVFNKFIWNSLSELTNAALPIAVSPLFWMSPIFLALALVIFLFAIFASPIRQRLRWRLPAFRDASLARVASAISLMLKKGVPLDEALALVEQLEKGTRAETEIAEWRQRLAAGRGKFSDLATPGRAFPPLFVWAIAQSGEDLPQGFQQAGELYQGRAGYRTELLLYSVLPCSILLLATMLLSQVQPVFLVLINVLKNLGSDS